MPRSSARHPVPAASALGTTARGPRAPTSTLLLALAALTSGAAAPALEYGPEAEARFLEKCTADDVTTPAAASCRRLMERLQAELSYHRFLEAAAGGPEAFGHPSPGPVVADSRAAGTASR